MRRSNVANAVPGGADLNEGELAINTMDGALYFKKSNGTIITGHDDTILHIDSTNSRVGIGTDSPAFALSVDAGTSDYPGYFKSTDNKAALIIADNDTTVYVSAENSRGSFGFNPGVNTANLNINSSGHLGLGIVSPSNLLHIHATGNGSSALIVEDDARRLELGRDMIQAKSSDGSTVQNLYIQPSGNTAFATNSGKVGIGITGPSATLHVQNTSTNGEVMRLTTTGDDPDRHMYFQSDHIYGSGNMYFGTGAYVNLFRASSHRFYYGTSNTEAMRVHTNGNVGIGATAPTSKLEVHGSVGTIPDTTNSSLQLRDTSAVGANNGGSIVFSGIYTGSSGFLGSGPYIKAYKLNATDGDYSYGLKFATRQNGVGSQAIGLTITPDQKVGIGTDTPSGTFHVVGTGVRIDTADGSGLTINRPGNSAHLNLFPAYSSVPTIMGDGAGGLHLGYNSSTAGIRIDTSNNVGIGTTSPQTKLDIAGASATDSPILRFTGTGEASQGDTVGEIQFYNSDTTDFTPGIMSSIRAIAGASGGEGQLQIYTNMPSEGTAAATLAAHFASDGNTIFGGTSVGAAGALSVKVDGSYTDLYLYGAGTSQGGRIFFGDSSDRSSITGTYGTGGGGKLTFKTDTTGGTSQDRLVIDSDGSIRFNNAFTFPSSIGSAGQVLKVPSSGSTLIWGTASGGGGASVEDNDGDTKIQVEESADEDIIRFDVAGTQKMFLDSGELNLTGDLAVSGNLNIAGDINSTSVTNLDVTDKTITMANNSGSSNAADGAGIIIEGPSSNASLLWDHTNQYLEFNKAVFSPTGFIIGTTATNVGRMYNSSGVMALEAYTTRQISFGNADNGEHVRIDADGKVGIGTTDPNANLHVGSSVSMGSQSNPAIQIGAADNYRFGVYTGNEDAIIENKNGDDGIAFRVKTAGEAMRIDGGTGNVGIGTDSPSEKLHVRTTGATVGKFETTATADLAVELKNSQGSMFFGLGGGEEFAVGTTSDLNGSGNLFAIKQDGKVGIGTVSPTRKLHVKGTGNTAIAITSPNTNYVQLALGDTDDDNYAQLILDNSSNKLQIQNGGGGVVGDRGITLDSSENVGIGTDSPREELEVNGTIFVTPTIYSANVNDYIVKVGASNNTGWDGMGFKLRSDGSGIPYITSHIASDVMVWKGTSVGVGTNSPGAKFNVNSATTIGWSNLANAYILAGTTGAGIGIDNNEIMAKGSGHLYFGTGDSGDDVVIRAGGTTAAVTVSGTNQRVGIAKSTPLARFQVEEYGIDTTGVTTTSTSQAAIHSFPITSFRSARFTIQITNTTDSTYHSTEILAIHDGTTANITEFGEVHTGSSVEATFDADISSGNFRLLATPTSTNTMQFKVVCHSLTV